MRRNAGRAARCCALLLLIALPSCTAPVFIVSAGLTVAQAGGAAYVSGALESAFAVDFDHAVQASGDALDHLGFTPLRRHAEGRKLTIVVEEMGGRHITIDIIKKTKKLSKIIIRVGFFGDQAISRLVLVQLQKEFELMGVSPAGSPLSGVSDNGG